MQKLKWRTDEPPVGIEIFCQVETYGLKCRETETLVAFVGEGGTLEDCHGDGIEWQSVDVDRWIYFSEILGLIEGGE